MISKEHVLVVNELVLVKLDEHKSNVGSHLCQIYKIKFSQSKQEIKNIPNIIVKYSKNNCL